MKIIFPENIKEKQEVKLGDILKTQFGDIYIAVKFSNEKFAWFNLQGYCANGTYDSLEELTSRSENYFIDSNYTIYSSDDYDLKLVRKGGK